MIIIQKYGGSIIDNIGDIKKIGNKIINEYDDKNKYIIILSAFKNKTNELINDLKNISSPINKYYSKYLSLGENMSCLLLSTYLSKYLNVFYLEPSDINMQCTSNYLDANILSLNINKLKFYLDKFDILIIPGFQGINNINEVVTLGRNGSDTTAIYIYNICNKITNSKCILYKDTALYQVDPKIVKSKHHEFISYKQIKLLNNLGNNIISSKGINILEENNLILTLEDINSNEQTIVSNKESDLDLLAIIPLDNRYQYVYNNYISMKDDLNVTNI